MRGHMLKRFLTGIKQILFIIVVVTLSQTSSADTLMVPIIASSDDVEEMGVNGNMLMVSPDLELVDDKGKTQTLGLRFTNVIIPPNAIIHNVYIEFTVDEPDITPAEFTFTGLLSDNAPTFNKNRYDITSRPTTSTSVTWSNIPPWSNAFDTVRSTDLSPIIQEIVNRTGWVSGNALAFIVTGFGERTAIAFEGDPANAPRLFVEFTPLIDIFAVKSHQVLNDPVNGNNNPKAIPGAEILYTITVTNQGIGIPDINTVFTTDPISSNASMFVGDFNGGGSGPVAFTDGAISSTLSYSYTNLNDPSDDLEFSTDGINFNYTPSGNFYGVDPNITHFRINPKGSFAAAVNGNNPSYTIRFKVRLK